MRLKKLEARLIRLCTLLDDVDLGERHDEIMRLVHNARRASHERQRYTALQYCIDALKQLRKARNTLLVAGTDAEYIASINSAISILVPVYDEARADTHAMLMAEYIEMRFLQAVFLIILALSVCGGFIWSVGWLMQN